MSLLLAVGLGLIALIITPGTLFYFDVTPKLAVLLVTLVAALVLLPWRARRSPRVPKTFTLLLALAAVSLTLSSLLSVHPSLSLIGTTWRTFGLIPQIAILAFAWFAATADRRVLLAAVTLSSALAALYGVAQYFGFDPVLPAAGYHIGQGIWTIVRPPGTLGYVSYFATWLAMAAFLALALAGQSQTRALILAARAAAALCAFAMLLTGTRAAILGLLAGAAVWLALRGFRLPRRTPLALLAVAVALGAFYFSPAGWNLRSRARWFVEDPAGGGRILLWRDSLHMAAARPIAGFGPEVFTAAFPPYETAALASKLPDFEYESPHNIFLDALTSQGILGLAALAALCVYGFLCATRTRRSPTDWIAAAFAAGLVSQQFTVFTLPTALLFYVSLVLLVPRRPTAAPAARATFSPALIALWPIAAGLLFAAIRLTTADHALAETQSAIAQRQVGPATTAYARYRAQRLPGPSADLWYSRSLLNLSQQPLPPAARALAFAQAYQAASLAPQTTDDPANAWYSLALFEATRNNSAAVESSLRSAIAARPNWFKPHWALSRLLQMEGRAADADRERALALALDAGKHPDLFAGPLRQIP